MLFDSRDWLQTTYSSLLSSLDRKIQPGETSITEPISPPYKQVFKNVDISSRPSSSSLNSFLRLLEKSARFSSWGKREKQLDCFSSQSYFVLKVVVKTLLFVSS